MWRETLYNTLMYAADKLTPLWAKLPGKAGEFFAGRKNWEAQLRAANIPPGGVWLHAASAGEYEQAKPLVAALREKYPRLPVTVTFFSPSGYKQHKAHIQGNVFYLPLDTPANARRFLDLVRPRAACMIKYEFWPHFLRETGKRNIPLFLVSGIFREDQSVWKYPLLKDSLKNFTAFFVQDDTSAALLKKHGFDNVTVTGDTRFDTVAELPGVPVNFPVVTAFKGTSPLIVAGSTWPEDEDMLADLMENHLPAGWKLFILPHEPTPAHIRRLEKKLRVPHARYSAFSAGDTDARVLIGDTVGLLKYVYRYGDWAYVGGGFGKGIHNILEAAVYGVPVIFGPRYHKFKEARDLVREGGAFSVDNTAALHALLKTKTGDERRKAGQIARDYVMRNTGATKKIMRFLEKYLS